MGGMQLCARNEEQGKLETLLSKFNTLEERINYECEGLLAEVQKYIIQTEFELN